MLFIFAGLTTQASSMNLIVYKFNNKENLKIIQNDLLLLNVNLENAEQSVCSLNLKTLEEEKHKYNNSPKNYSYRPFSFSNWYIKDTMVVNYKNFPVTPRKSLIFDHFDSNQIKKSSTRFKRNSI